MFHDYQPEHTHDIELLLRTAALYADEFASWIDLGIELTPYARLYRYPGLAVEPEHGQFERALSAAEKLYELVISLLPPEVQ